MLLSSSLLLLLAAATATAAPTAWPQFRADLQGKSQAAPGTLTGSGTVTPRWIKETAGPVQGSPAVDSAGNAYVGTTSGILWKLDSQTGKELWRVNLAGPVSGGVLLLGKPHTSGIDGVIVGDAGGRVWCVDAETGGVAWVVDVGGAVAGSIVPLSGSSVPTSGLLVLGCFEPQSVAKSKGGAVVILEASSGATVARYQVDGSVTATPALDVAGNIFVGTNGFALYALTPKLTLRWSYGTEGLLSSSPAVSTTRGASTVYVGSYDQKVYAFDASSGQLKWNFTTGASVHSSPAS
jgi:eukaryotic-like serine/threonine-protein kinase